MTEKSVSKVSRVINCLIVALLIFAMCMICFLQRKNTPDYLLIV